MRVRTLWVLLWALVLAWPAAAQEQRGSIEGVVKDSGAAVLPGVSVEARSVGGGVLSTTTGANGTYRFPSVLPGTYEVRASLPSFAPAKINDVVVTLGGIKTVDFTLTPAGLTEMVTVTAEAPVIDTKQSARATVIRGEQVELLPHDRDFTSLVTQAPGAYNEPKSGGIMIDGSSASENRYVVDGIETTALVNGLSGKNVIADFVEEVQVKSTGYPAEYGGSTGGVINVLTKSGTNRLSGNVLTFWQGSHTTGANNPTLRLGLTDPTIAQFQTYPKDDTNRLEPGGALGGPIVKDKAWFFGAYQPALTKISRTVTATSSGNPSASPSTTAQTQRVQYLTANETMQLGDKLRTRIAFNNSWNESLGLLAKQDGSDQAGTDYSKGSKYPSWSLSATADYVVSEHLFIGFRVGRFLNDRHDVNVLNQPQFNFSSSTNVGMAGVPAGEQHQTGYASIPSNSAYSFDTLTRNFAQIDATYYAHAAGDHQIKGGVQIDHRGENINQGNLQNVVNLHWGQSFQGQSGPFGYYELRSNTPFPREGVITQGNVRSNVNGIFLQDTWTMSNRLTINAGVRTENENVPAYTNAPGVTANPISFGMKDKIAPRVGFAYDMTGDGKWKAYGSWGIFYDIFKLNLPQGSFGGQKWISWYYTLDTPFFETVRENSNCPPACSGTQIGPSVDFRAVSVTPGLNVEKPGQLKPMRSQELSFGFEHQLNSVMAMSIRYVHKQLDRGIEDVGDLGPQGEAYIIANPGEGLVQKFDISTGTSLFAPQGATNLTQTLPKPVRVYNSVELAIDKRLAHNWFLRGSYTLSRDHGNYSGLSESDENGRTAPNSGRSFDYPAEEFIGNGTPLDGPFQTDRTHAVKAQAIYAFKWGTSVGINEYAASGIPINRQVAIIVGHGYPVYYNGRGSDGRTPFYSQTDLFVQHELKIGGNRRVQLSANVLNLFNQRTVINTYDTVGRSGAIPLGPGYYTEAAFYAGQLNFDQLIQKAETTGARPPLLANPEFLMPRDYQAPILARFGVKFMF
jgi:hypothetical protein